ncbi:MAG: 4-amino-4-deoxy-L-arabinose transferase [Pelagibacterales bacterium]|nr:4-amino-4-deoxy-L-arabinose transferase [Pelagibacterales bacterium]PPR15681.1 MAG: 4-amino-4-deoxy-L-arabinose-phosphoundecaprenol flippase subunit ArnE [Alphaproteobacteria bacterium MarineAlpha9_Bin3]|tara:strand:- start:4799 stop:5179 length:381 start_codon:yes stop_codon:yes gene_type:complete
MMLTNLIFIVTSVLLNALAQILLKAGMKNFGNIDLKNNITQTVLSISLNPYIISGFISYGISIILWLWVLSKVDVSLAYPFQALGYIIVTILAWLVFQENINLIRIIALIFITLGLIILAFSSRVN